MATTIKIKSSSVAGKAPAAGDLAISELAVNLADRKLYSKDTNDAVIELGGFDGQIPQGGTADLPASPSLGDLFFDTDLSVLLYWNGSEWVSLQQVQSNWEITDENDPAFIQNKPLNIGANAPADPEDGYVWIDIDECPAKLWIFCDGSWNQVQGGGGGGTTLQFPVSIQSSNGSEIGSTLTAVGGDGVNAEGTPLTATYAWTGAKTGTGETILADVEGTYTVTATINDGVKDYERDASFAVADSYEPPENKTRPVIDITGGGTPNPGDTIYIDTPATVIKGENVILSGNSWLADGVATGSTGSTYTIEAADNGKTITLQQSFIDGRGNSVTSEPSNGIGPVELTVLELPDTLTIQSNETQAGLIGATLTVNNDPVATGGSGSYVYSYQWRVGEVLIDPITLTPTPYVIQEEDAAKTISLFKKAEDSVTRDESPTRESNSIEAAAAGIDFSVQVVDDGGNNPGNIITASAQGITGGVDPTKIEYQWYSDGSPAAPPNTDTYVIGAFDIGKTITVDVTVSEPDGSGAVTKTGTYDKIPEIGAEINQPSVLTPPDGAGIGGDVTYTPETSEITGVVETAGWTTTTTPEERWRSVTYGDGKFVAVSTNTIVGDQYGTNRVMYSTDNGITWTTVNVTTGLGLAGVWHSVAYGNNMFVVVGASVRYYSSDAINWTQVLTSSTMYDICYGDNKFVAVGATDKIAYSTDGINWTNSTVSNSNAQYRGVTYGELPDGTKRFVAVSNVAGQQVSYSSDGITWSNTSVPEDNNWECVAYGNNVFVAGAEESSGKYRHW